jgi:hypothetical protein
MNRLCTTDHERELTRRCNARPITGDELELIQLVREFMSADEADIGTMKRRLTEEMADSLAVVESDNEARRVRESARMADEGWMGESEAAE